MWLVGADQVVGLVMVVMGSRSDKNNSLAELYKSHMYYNKSHLIIPSPPPRNGTLVLLPVVPGTGRVVLALPILFRCVTAVKLGKLGENGRMGPDSLAVLLFHCLNMSIIQQLGVVGEQQTIVKTCRSYNKLIGWITMELAGQLG
jgi:hypothetical protein